MYVGKHVTRQNLVMLAVVISNTRTTCAWTSVIASKDTACRLKNKLIKTAEAWIEHTRNAKKPILNLATAVHDLMKGMRASGCPSCQYTTYRLTFLVQGWREGKNGHLMSGVTSQYRKEAQRQLLFAFDRGLWNGDGSGHLNRIWRLKTFPTTDSWK